MPRTHQYVVTLTVHTNKIKPAEPNRRTSPTSTTDTAPVVVIHEDVQQMGPTGWTVCSSRPNGGDGSPVTSTDTVVT